MIWLVIANTSVVYDKAHKVEIKYIINKNNGAKWYYVG